MFSSFLPSKFFSFQSSTFSSLKHSPLSSFQSSPFPSFQSSPFVPFQSSSFSSFLCSPVSSFQSSSVSFFQSSFKALQSFLSKIYITRNLLPKTNYMNNSIIIKPSFSLFSHIIIWKHINASMMTATFPLQSVHNLLLRLSPAHPHMKTEKDGSICFQKFIHLYSKQFRHEAYYI